ncbi:glycosyltransferase family 4 protein [Sphingomonas sp. R647]|uniref:glycosyltransferase family 4 protein n=1 Tax=Sphingomonas sp. R647 TaxID=2875233 RepID=UPI001CD34FA5|nr:glycosyltransferase family 4 protein [Sphingomonas sp. R647]MCA1196341.1 glycosyltransferase family 4 protein [Sphingomonas sp. R647]
MSLRARPRVLHIITHLDMGGAEGVAMQLIDSLRGSFDFSLFAVLEQRALSAVGIDMAQRLDAWGVARSAGVAGRFKSGGVVLAALALNRTIRRVRPDIIHVHTEIPELTLALACRLSRYTRSIPLLRTVHNSELWIDWNRIGSWVTETLAHGDAVAVSRSAADADWAIATRTARPRADILHNGVAPPPPVQPVGARRRFQLLFAGRLVHQKGADLLPAILEAAWRATARRDVIVTIAGTGPLEARVRAGLADRLSGWTVQFVPPIERLSHRLGDYDVVLLPSRFEGFALLPLEVLMAGVPIVTTRAPGLDEAIPADYPFLAGSQDVTGLAARLVEVIEDPAHARVVAADYGALLAERFSPAAMAQGYAERYQALAGAGRA